MRKRILAVAALALAMLGTTATSVQTASATTQQAAAGPIYWAFEDATRVQARCLTEFSSGVIRMADCDGGTAQQWYWINSSWSEDGRRLVNRWTGDCLVAPTNLGEDAKSGTCEDWTSRLWWVSTLSETPIASLQGGSLTFLDAPNTRVVVGYKDGLPSGFDIWMKQRMN
ncbi:hypothetical protein ACFYXS_01335 [Streptomyces sp. NPDC002574]|uniref:hypothetical protein n=1 Tax=Streptomyces sp. NPDC002574 TaxID=3364652 RepID=UPI0036928317